MTYEPFDKIEMPAELLNKVAEQILTLFKEREEEIMSFIEGRNVKRNEGNDYK